MMKMTMQRLNKYLASCGVGSRRNSEELILQGRVSVNGKIIVNLAQKVDAENDEVCVDGEIIRAERNVYFLLNKPAGVITSTKDEKHRRTVIDLVRSNSKIFPVGRLDYNTTGVLLLTNDGEFSNYVTHPKNKFKRVYVAQLDEPISPESRKRLLKGVFLDRRKSRFIDFSFPKAKNYKLVRVSTNEGRNHFVKRMFEVVGRKVVKLHRESFCGFTVKGLKPGEYRNLNLSEVNKVFKVN